MSHKPSVGLKLKPDLSTPENREYWEWVKKQREFWELRREQDRELRGKYYALLGDYNALHDENEMLVNVLHRVINLTEEIYLGEDTYKGRKTLSNVHEANQLAREAVGRPTTASRLHDIRKLVEGNKCLVTEDGTVVGVQLVEKEDA